LPIELTQFYAVCNDQTTVLNWSTATELNSNEFTIEKGTDAHNFETIGVIPAAGNSYTTQFYTFTDEAPSFGNTYYRLKQTDKNGQAFYSTVIITNCLSTGEQFEILSCGFYQNSLLLEVLVPASGDYMVRLFDIQGQKLIFTCVQLTKGYNHLSPSCQTSFGEEMYLVTLSENENGRLAVEKILKTF
ncbi:MAG: hypothetical protein H7X71_07070, partial [Chitinophagales bacterium]|nr:hypothetical protein [Chitinophagales bacterium]